MFKDHTFRTKRAKMELLERKTDFYIFLSFALMLVDFFVWLFDFNIENIVKNDKSQKKGIII